MCKLAVLQAQTDFLRPLPVPSLPPCAITAFPNAMFPAALRRGQKCHKGTFSYVSCAKVIHFSFKFKQKERFLHQKVAFGRKLKRKHTDGKRGGFFDPILHLCIVNTAFTSRKCGIYGC